MQEAASGQMILHYVEAQVEPLSFFFWTTLRFSFCRILCVGTPDVSADRPHSNEWGVTFLYSRAKVGVHSGHAEIYNKWVKHAETKFWTFIFLPNLSKFFSKYCQKIILFGWQITFLWPLRFACCPCRWKDHQQTRKKKPHFSTRVNACGSALTSTAVLKQALWWLIDSRSSRLPLSLTGEMSASALGGGWSQSLYSSRLPERGSDEIALVLMDVRAMLTLSKEQALCLH